MFNWFKKKVQQLRAVPLNTSTEKKIEKPKKIGYNPDLIATLKTDHKNLLSIYTEILTAAEKQKFTLVTKKLVKFSKTLKNHLWKEHVDFYVYLENILPKEQEAFKHMHKKRLEMDKIFNNVVGFLHTWQHDSLTTENAPQFIQELTDIGKILVARIAMEENDLYSLYQER